LDKEDDEGKVLYADGFSRNPQKQAIVPDFLFFSDEVEYDLNEIYGTKNKQYKVKGLINILNGYKFTISENTPIEEEVALDPELLGKTFENLLASYNPETQITARKQTGSFYTPREIVDYIVDESIVAYLEQKLEVAGICDKEDNLRKLISYSEAPNLFTENETSKLIEAIDTCKILDPACGSGAFPMGVLHKLVHCLHKLDPNNALWKERQIEKIRSVDDAALRSKYIDGIEAAFKHNELDYGRKLYLIENCIFGVDIQPIAVQISKLRFFISLVVDQIKDPKKENLGILSLPNLETKFVAADTLIGLEKPKIQTDLFENKEIYNIEEKLKELRHKYFSANSRNDKIVCQKEDMSLRQKISRLLEKTGYSHESAMKVAAFDPYDQNKAAGWFDPEWMFGYTKGFNIIIGNPPYGITYSREQKLELRQLYPESQFKIDSYSLFVLKSIDLLENGGYCAYIITNTLLDNYFEEKVRERLLKETSIKEINDLDDKVFETAVVHTMIFCYAKIINASNYVKVNYTNDLSTGFHFIPQAYFKKQEKYNFSIREFENKDLISILKTNTVPFSQIIDLRQAIKSGDDGKYILTKATKKNHKPILRGKDVFKWKINVPYLYIDYGNWLACPRDNRIFEQPKILIREAGSTIIASYDDNNYYIMSSLYNGILCNKKYRMLYILCLVNSKLFQFLMNKITFEKTKGAFTKAKKYHYNNLPVRNIDDKTQIKFQTLAGYLLISNQNEQKCTDVFECLIDAMVYEIYLQAEITAVDANVLKYLNNMPEIENNWSEDKKMKTIQNYYKELSNPAHPISIAVQKQKTVSEIKIIEGLDK